MFSKSKNKTSSFLFGSKTRRVVFFVLAAVLVMGELTNFALAVKVTYDQNQLHDLENTFGLSKEQISNLGNSGITFDDFTKRVNEELTSPTYKDKTSAAAAQTAANSVYNEVANPATSGDTVSTSLNQFSASAALDGLKEGLASVVLAVVIGVLSIIVGFLKLLVYYAAQALDFTLNPSLYNFSGSPIVVQGWVVVRDVCNLFFLLVLLFIAICTILKIEKYHAKKTLLMLIIMALLINFSKPITVFIFDGSQLLMNFFLRQMGQTGTGQATSTVVAQASNIAEIVYKTLPNNNGSVAVAIQYLFGVVFLFMLAVAFVVTALMLIIRIVAIMLLIIVSPLAFFAAVIPDFSKMGSKWWSALFEYSYYGPAAAFFLLLATQLGTFLPKMTTAASGQTMDATVGNIINFLVVLVFLYASILMAKQFGGGVGGAVVGNANKFMKWGSGFYKGGGMWGGAARITGAADVYKGVKQGIAERKGWRVLTKEGREKASKEREERWKKKVAPFSMAAARKEADDRKNDDQKKVDAGIAKGNAADLLIASKRGTLTDEQIASAAVISTISQSKELRKEVLGNLRDKGNTHLAAYLRYKTKEMEDEAKPGEKNWRNASLEDFGEKEINDNKKLADMNWEKVMEPKFKSKEDATINFKISLVNRMQDIADTDPRRFLNILSNLDGARLNIIKNDKDFKSIIERARVSAGGGQRNRGAESQTGGYQSSGYGP